MALSLASHARKRGWNGNAGETVQIAEAITARIIASGRGGGEGAQAGQAALSEAEIVVARNGFINFAARVLKALPAITVRIKRIYEQFTSAKSRRDWVIRVFSVYEDRLRA